jgi:hypothetical protein
MSLPRSLMFPNLKNSAAMSYAIGYEAFPTNSKQEYYAGGTLQFRAPCSVYGQFCDTSSTYLRFSVEVELTPTAAAATAGTAPTCESLGYHFIQALKLTTAQGSRVIEEINNYPVVHDTYRTLMSDSSNYGSDSILLGANPTNMRAGKHITSGTQIHYAIPLISVLGTQSAGQNMIPLCLLDSLELSLTLASAAQALACSAATATANYKVTAPVLCLQLVRLQPETMTAISNAANGNFSWSGQVIRTSEVTQNSGESFASIALNGVAMTSLRHILATIRTSNTRESILYQSVTDCHRNHNKSFRFKIQDQYVTGNAISLLHGAADAYMQLRRCLGTHCTAESMPTLHDKTSFSDKNLPTAPSVNATYGSLCLSANCSPFAQQEALKSGALTRGSQVSLELVVDEGQITNVQNAIITVIACGDAVFSVQGRELAVSWLINLCNVY